MEDRDKRVQWSPMSQRLRQAPVAWLVTVCLSRALGGFEKGRTAGVRKRAETGGDTL